MKNLLAALATTLMATVSFAQDNSIKIEKGDMSVYPVSAKIVETKIVSPGTRSEKTLVTLQFTLGSCVDRLAAVNFAQAGDEGSAILHVQGLAVANEMSMRVRCFAPQIENRVISIWGGFEKDQLHLQPINMQVTQKAPEPRSVCLAYWTGFVFNAEKNTCEQKGTSGCSNPFEFKTIEQCKTVHGLN